MSIAYFQNREKMKRAVASSLIAVTCATAAVLLSCVPPGPENEPVPDMSLFVRWMINGHRPNELICNALSPGTVSIEVWEDSDCDGNLNDGFYIYTFDCDGGVCFSPGEDEHGDACGEDADCGGGSGFCYKGGGKTGNYFFSDTDTCIQLVLVTRLEESEEDVILAWDADFQGDVCRRYCEAGFCYENYEDCPEDCYCEVNTGGDLYRITHDPGDRPECRIDEGGSFSSCRDLGTVDFDLSFEDFGPLDVDLTWETADASKGTCLEAETAVMGYVLEKRYETEEEGTVYRVLDEVNLESASPCRDSLNWALVPFGFYRLEVKGRNESGSVIWEADCEDDGGGDLDVRSREENHYECQVVRL